MNCYMKMNRMLKGGWSECMCVQKNNKKNEETMFNFHRHRNHLSNSYQLQKYNSKEYEPRFDKI